MSSGIPVKHVAADIWTDACVVIARSVGASLDRCAPQAGSSFSVGTYAPISFSNSVSATRGSIHPPPNRQCPSPTQTPCRDLPSSRTSPIPPPLRCPQFNPVIRQPQGNSVTRCSWTTLGPRCMHLPSGVVHPLRPPSPHARVVSNAELGLCDPIGPVSLLACVRAGRGTRRPARVSGAQVPAC